MPGTTYGLSRLLKFQKIELRVIPEYCCVWFKKENESSRSKCNQDYFFGKRPLPVFLNSAFYYMTPPLLPFLVFLLRTSSLFAYFDSGCEKVWLHQPRHQKAG